jgi:hypothetical protein
MKFDCKKISLNDEELGYQVTFSENEGLGEKAVRMSVREMIESQGRYLLLQRSYPEDEFENDNYYYETLDENLCGDLLDFEMVLSMSRFEFKLPLENIEISISPTENEYSELKRILQLITSKKGSLIIKE